MVTNIAGNVLGTLGGGGANPLGALTNVAGGANPLGQLAGGLPGQGLSANGFSKALDFEWNKPDAQQTLRAGIQTTDREQAARRLGLDGFGDSAPTRAVENISNAFKTQLNELQTIQSNAEVAVQDYAAGQDIPLHQVMMQVNRAELSLQLATQVRNKMLSAYQEISRMPI